MSVRARGATSTKTEKSRVLLREEKDSGNK